MKRVLWSIALGAVIFMFYACGEGAIEVTNSEDNLALLNYGEFNSDGMQGLVSEAMAECEADPRCKQAMENSEDIPRPANVTSSSSADSSKAPADSSDTPADSTLSSSETAPASSQEAAESSSTAQPESAATSSETVVSSSSQSKTITPTQFIGSCKASSGVKGFPITWSFEPITYCTLASNCSLVPETYEWTFQGGDIETSADEKPQVVYANKGNYTASVKLTNGEVEQTVECTSVEIIGPEVTGCTCGEPVLKSSSNKISGSQSTVQYEWTVSGCSSVDGAGNEETKFTYSWSGDGISGNTEVGTGNFTKMGLYSAKVTVTNSDGQKKDVTCENKATVDDASWTFKCTPINSTERPSNSMYSQAESCHYMDINSDGRFVAENKTSNIVTFTYRDCSGNISTKQLQTSESQLGDDGGGYWNKIGERFHCTVYYYFSAAGEFGLAVW